MREKKPLRHYFDYAATTPVDPRVTAAMLPYFADRFGNPGSLHSFGQEAVAAVDAARETIGGSIGAGFREIIFTGSATEANNMALRGAIRGYRVQGIGSRGTSGGKNDSLHPRIIISAVEHESVFLTARDLERDGVEVVVIPVGRDGVIDLNKLKKSLNERAVLVSVMYVNNETGTIQPIAEISKIINAMRMTRMHPNTANSKKDNSKNSNEFVDSNRFPLFHTDAAQAFQFLPCDVEQLGVDMMTLSAHKIYGPKGVGTLYIRKQLATGSGQLARDGRKPETRGKMLEAIITGGGQEFGLRSGTENVPLIAGFAEAAKICETTREQHAKRIASLRDDVWRGLKKIYPRAQLNGPAMRMTRMHPNTANSKKDNSKNSSAFVDSNRVPHILNIYFPDMLAEELLVRLDLAGIAVSSGSACSARSAEPSHVIQALGYSKDRARRSLRVSFGRPTTTKDVIVLLREIKNCLRYKR